MATDRTNITVIYPSDIGSFGAVDMLQPHFCALVDGVPMPEELADLFTATIIRDGDKVRVRVDFA